MWLAVEKFLIALFLPIFGLFSFQNREAVPPLAAPAAGIAQTVPQPVMRENAAKVSNVAKAATEQPGISLDTLKNCLNRAGESGRCLDETFREFFKTHSTRDALAAVQRYEDSDLTLRLSCHPVVHAIGRETFRMMGTVQDSFTACDQTCHSGCYHGAMERFLRGSAAGDDEAAHISPEELRDKAAAACDSDQPTRFRFQCLHGLGHALLFFSEYRLSEALGVCDTLPDPWSRSSCYGGLFMENVFSVTPEKRDLSPTDYHYPCSKLEAGYKPDCYMMQTTRMSEMGLSTEQLFGECRAAGAYRFSCMQSIGRDLSNDARVGDPRRVAEKCELGIGEERRSCTRGTAYALLDNTWDGRYAFPLCASFRAEADVSYCFTISSSYMRSTFERRPEEIRTDCQTYAANAVHCPEVAGG